MRIQVIKRALGLLVVDIVIIIGIFILQFRADSSIIEKLGNLQITLANSDTDDGKVFLKNQLQITYNGLIIAFDDQKPATIYSTKDKENKAEPIQLITWARPSELSYEFDFTNDVKLLVALSSEEADATLSLHSEVPAGYTLYIPYSYGYSTKIQKDDGNRMVLNNKKSSWEMEAYGLSEGKISFTHGNSLAIYSVYDDSQQFSFDSITDLPIAVASTYNENVENFKTNLINSFKSVNIDAATPEQNVVSYIAAMAERGEYVAAVESIPQNFKRSGQRTYLSAPYLNTLNEMNILLDNAITENSAMINRSAANLTLDIFTVRNIAPFMCINTNKQNVVAILNNAAAYDYKNATLSQAVGVIQVYSELSKIGSEYAQLLVPAIDGCIERITASCSLNGNVLTVSENDTFLSVVQAVETGVTVLRCGITTENQMLQKAGYAIVNSYIAESSSFDLRTLSNLYPILAYNNWYYPHFEKIENAEGDLMWAWTCAKSIKYNKDSSDEISYTIDFPEGFTHYVIIKGVPHFRAIYIYGMAFRTDPRFETYNSSGYVYKRDTGTLLLKSRHRSQNEIVRLEVGEPVTVNKPVEPTPAPAEETPVEDTTPVAPAEAPTTEATSAAE